MSPELSQEDMDLIASYPEAMRRLEMGTSPGRCLRVAKAWLRDQEALANGDPREHPTEYNRRIVDAIEQRLSAPSMILDPMAGPMRKLRELERMDRGGHLVWGVEIEPEWAHAYPHDRLLHGDARHMPWRDHMFDVVAVSPSYGNRFADRTGEWWDNCDRPTYAGKLGRNPSAESLCVPFSAAEYRQGHMLAWAEAVRALRPGGLFFLNVKNFVQGGVIQRVCQWHRDFLREGLGLEEIDDTAVSTKGLHAGANYQVRAEQVEKLYILARPQAADVRVRMVKEQHGKEYA